MPFQDHFSSHAKEYALYRPEYPAALFEWLASIAPGHALAIDCATGNGQAARGLAPFFAAVDALDASASQIANAEGPANVSFRVAPAEETGVATHSADLVTIAQALHWVDHRRYFAEVIRILRPGGLFAAWGYGRFLAEEPILSISREALWKPLEPFWPPERQWIESAFATIDFPLVEIQPPPLSIELDWTRQDLGDYVRTWSAAKNYTQQTGGRALDEFEARLAEVWPADVRRGISMPIFLRVGRTAKGPPMATPANSIGA